MITRNDDPPEDHDASKAEAFLDAFYDQITRLRLPLIKEEKLEDLSSWIWKQIIEAYSEGYIQARDDRRMAEEQAYLDATVEQAHKDGTMP